MPSTTPFMASAGTHAPVAPPRPSSGHGRHRPLGSTSTRDTEVVLPPPRASSLARSTPRTRVKNPSMMTSGGRPHAVQCGHVHLRTLEFSSSLYGRNLIIQSNT